MFDGDVAELDADAALTVAAQLRATADRAEARLLEVAAHFADLHPVPAAQRPGVVILPGMENVFVCGGEGCPEVAEFAPAELGAALGVSTNAATADFSRYALRRSGEYTTLAAPGGRAGVAAPAAQDLAAGPGW